jgi:hypothetical protein
MSDFRIREYVRGTPRWSHLRPWPTLDAAPGGARAELVAEANPRGLCACSPKATECPAFRRMRVAYHEAGHAVIAHAVWPSRPVLSASISPDGQCLGLVRLGCRSHMWLAELHYDEMADAVRAEADTIVHLGGYEAEFTFCAGIAPPANPVVRPDCYAAGRSSCVTCEADDDPMHHVMAYRGRTQYLLSRPAVSRAIVRTAVHLLRAGELNGSDIGMIIAEEGVRSERTPEPWFWRPRDDGEDADEDARS